MQKYEEWKLRRNVYDEEQRAEPMHVDVENISQVEQENVNNKKGFAHQTDEERLSTSRGTMPENTDIPSVNSFQNILLSLVKEQKLLGGPSNENLKACMQWSRNNYKT